MTFLKLSIISLLGLFSICCQASGPEVYLEQKLSPMIQLINKESVSNKKNMDSLVNKLTDMILPIVDSHGISKSVTGKYWSKASTDMQDKFSKKFVRLIVRSFIAYITAGEGVSAMYRPVADSSQKLITVTSQVKFKTGEKWRVEYLLSKSDDDWLIEDITLDGLSLVTSYREQFRPILEEKGFNGLYELVSKVAK